MLAIASPIVGLCVALPWERVGTLRVDLGLAAAGLGIVLGLLAICAPRRRDLARHEAVGTDAPPPRAAIAPDEGAVRQLRDRAEAALRALCGTADDEVGSADAGATLIKTADEVSRAAMRAVSEATAASVAADDVQHDLDTVTVSSREFLDTIAQIGVHAASSASMGVSAFEKAEATTANVDELLVASRRIGEMTALVASIARQTNLLALNATIEAARAGEHGRSFAVVAGEVKALAGESAKAAAAIAEMATQIYGSTERTIGSIRAISEVIGGLNTATNAIAVAVEERVEAATSMTGSVERVATHIGHVADAIARIEAAADETLQGAGFIRRGATDLAARTAAVDARIGRCADALAMIAAQPRPVDETPPVLAYSGAPSLAIA